MSVSKNTIDMVYAQLKSRPKGATYNELAKLTDLSVHTLRLAIGNLKNSGSVILSGTRPAVIKAIEAPPMPGQTLVIREPMPSLEIDSKMVSDIIKQFDVDKKYNDELFTVLFHRVRTNSLEKNENLMVFLINFAEAIRTRLATEELSIDDLNGK